MKWLVGVGLLFLIACGYGNEDNGFFSGRSDIFSQSDKELCETITLSKSLFPGEEHYPEDMRRGVGFPIEIRIINNDKKLELYLQKAMDEWENNVGFPLFHYSGVWEYPNHKGFGISVKSVDEGEFAEEGTLGTTEPRSNLSRDECEYFSGYINVERNDDKLVPVLVHEIGHAIGLQHDDISGSIMNPFLCSDCWITPHDAKLVGDKFSP